MWFIKIILITIIIYKSISDKTKKYPNIIKNDLDHDEVEKNKE